MAAAPDPACLSTIIARARNGDRTAFGVLEGRFRARVERFVDSRLGARLRVRLEASDLVQETFLRAFRAVGQLRGDTEAAFWSWLATIARHVVEEAGRRLAAQKAGADREVPLDDGPADASVDLAPAGLADAGLTPSGIARADERFDRLRDALETLSPDHREVIRLARLQALPLREVGLRMHRSEKAVSVLLLRALLKLREVFGATESFHLPDRSLEDEAFGEREE